MIIIHFPQNLETTSHRMSKKQHSRASQHPHDKAMQWGMSSSISPLCCCIVGMSTSPTTKQHSRGCQWWSDAADKVNIPVTQPAAGMSTCPRDTEMQQGKSTMTSPTASWGCWLHCWYPWLCYFVIGSWWSNTAGQVDDDIPQVDFVIASSWDVDEAMQWAIVMQ
jgi:hypothetical protein